MNEGMIDWVEEFPGAVTVSSKDGTILYMNAKASSAFAKQGGREALVGSKLDDCHNAASRAIIRGLIEGGKPNAYTVQKGGVCKFIYQSPWFEGGELAGLVELSMEIPGPGAAELPHFDRG